LEFGNPLRARCKGVLQQLAASVEKAECVLLSTKKGVKKEERKKRVFLLLKF